MLFTARLVLIPPRPPPLPARPRRPKCPLGACSRCPPQRQVRPPPLPLHSLADQVLPRPAAATFEGEFSSVTTSYAGKGVVRYSW